MSRHLLGEADGPVTVITFNNPDKLNAILDDMHGEIAGVWSDLTADSGVRAVVVTGAGRAFSAGGDIPGVIRSADDVGYRRETPRTAPRPLHALAQFPKPRLPAGNGPALRLGRNIALRFHIGP